MKKIFPSFYHNKKYNIRQIEKLKKIHLSKREKKYSLNKMRYKRLILPVKIKKFTH